MGHSINAVIGNQKALAPLITQLGAPDPTELDFGLVIVPLDEARLDALAVSEEASYDGFTYLTPLLAEALGSSLAEGRALYLETEYFGGLGGQAAALFENGAMVWRHHSNNERPQEKVTWFDRLFRRVRGPLKSPISQGLKMMGVVTQPEGDEFDRLGLVRFRSLETLGIQYDD